ncbi:hypothetical protein MYE70_10135 [Marinobacter alexandrii]|jgi:hypothetical protein|uniref:hypothetical protein n=1 Tax=Marinobacter alexandrii TaxID=2570351 RepID=UPI001FFED3B7|nr:hypothetical protein [Marinobacter alexandrii]MCK2149424.1 hypothetical protein [Marinobacter alexandrii]
MDVSTPCAKSEHLKGIHKLVLDWGYSASESATLDWLEALLESHEFYPAIGFERTKTTHVYAKALKPSRK